jgi:hypothetical protein
MKHKLPYLKHMWKWKDGRFVCLRRKCKAEKKTRVSPETSEECRLWEKEKNV